MADTQQIGVDPENLRALVRGKYRVVATDPGAGFHFHTGRALAGKLGYDRTIVDALPDRAVESFAGVADPLTLRSLQEGERVVDLGSGAGFDCFVAAIRVGPGGHVVGIDMTPEMLGKARGTAGQLGLDHVEFREGIIEAIPVEDGWADVVMSNGVLNLVADKRAAQARSVPCAPAAPSRSRTSLSARRSLPRRPATPSCGPTASPEGSRSPIGCSCWMTWAS